MKRYLIFFVILMSSKIVFSQTEKVNWIIFIDGKIPQSTVLHGELICFENTPKEKIIPFEYVIGDIVLSKEDMDFVRQNGKSIDFLKLKLFYREFTKNARNLYSYSFQIEPKLLLPIYDYVVFRITNLNKKKGTYYMGYSTSYESTPWIKQEAHIFHEIIPNTSKKGIFNNNIEMKRVFIK